MDRHFLTEEGHYVRTKTKYQDNKSTILLTENGKVYRSNRSLII